MNLKQVLTVAAAAVTALSAGGALAQNQMASPGGTVFSGISASDLMAELNAAGVATELMDSEDGEPSIKAVTSGGATFFLFMRSCDGAPLRCSLIQTNAYFSAAGVTLGQLNEFMIQQSVTSYSMLLPGDVGTVSAKIWLTGGIARDNLLFELAAFLYDADNLVSSLQPGTAAQVSFKPSRSRVAGDAAGRVRPDAADVNPVGVNAPRFLTGSLETFVE